ncbi:hypothetical protein M4R22_09745 [Acidovorax sp. GBBC 3334]|uniref:hypothetical protein n=1 Tax=Acidovorax sp. GBBC 3334 TaxID=2940496 RepID=UPI002303F243|nr:hypothetical protein [Acidovorax sp. GBBC 3334]MDA8455047.1 hypothetical protein [Acidovorax sp. GBBC 3334]
MTLIPAPHAPSSTTLPPSALQTSPPDSPATPSRTPARLASPEGMPTAPGPARTEGGASPPRSPTPSRPSSPGRTADANADAPTEAAAGLLQRTRKAAKEMARLSDARTVLMRADDAEYLAALKGPGTDPENPVLPIASTLPALSEGVDQLRTKLQHPSVPEALRAHFEPKLAHLESTLDALKTEQPLAHRAAAYLPMNLLLPVVPFAIPAYSHQNQFVAELAGLYAKTGLMAVGAMRSPTAANRHSVMDHFMSRHYINVVQAAIFALPTFVPQLQKLNASPAFNVGAGMASTAALFLGFFGKEMREMVQQRRHGVPDPALAAAGRALDSGVDPLAARLPTQEPALPGDGGVPPARDLLTDALARARTDLQALTDGKTGFLDQGKELSPTTSKQVTLAANAFLDIATDLERVLHPDGTAGAGMANPDRAAKTALALFTTAVCLTTTALMYPDRIGMVDLGSDAAFTAALMLHNAANPNMTRGDALEEFKSFAGLSLVMIAVLVANRAAGDFIEKDTTGMLLGSAAMALLNMTIPGPIGHAAGAGIEKLLSLRPAELWEAARGVGHNALELFQQLARRATPAPAGVEIAELPDAADLPYAPVPH